MCYFFYNGIRTELKKGSNVNRQRDDKKYNWRINRDAQTTRRIFTSATGSEQGVMQARILTVPMQESAKKASAFSHAHPSPSTPLDG